MVNFSRVDAVSYPKTKNIIWKGFGTYAFPFPNPGGDGKQRAPYIINSKKGSRIPGARASLTIPTLESSGFHAQIGDILCFLGSHKADAR